MRLGGLRGLLGSAASAVTPAIEGWYVKVTCGSVPAPSPTPGPVWRRRAQRRVASPHSQVLPLAQQAATSLVVTKLNPRADAAPRSICAAAYTRIADGVSAGAECRAEQASGGPLFEAPPTSACAGVPPLRTSSAKSPGVACLAPGGKVCHAKLGDLLLSQRGMRTAATATHAGSAVAAQNLAMPEPKNPGWP